MRPLLLTSLALSAFALLAPVVTAQPTLPTWTLREELRLDSETHDFPGISSVAVGPRGRMAVYIGADKQMRMFDADGREVFRFGRGGAGPGEFQQASAIRFTGDSVWVSDFATRRVTVVGPNGKLVRTQSLPAVTGVISFVPSYIANGAMSGSGVFRAAQAEGATSSTWHIRVASDSTLTKLVETTSTLLTVSEYREGSGQSLVVPFSTQDARGFSSTGDRFAIANTITSSGPTVDLHVRSYKVDGTLQFERRVPVPSRPVTARQRDSALAVTEKMKPFGPELARMARPLVPTVHPMHARVVQGKDGSVLLGTRSAQGTLVMMVFNSGGTPVAYITPPPRTFIHSADATHLWVTQTDDDGLPSIVRYRIVR